VKSLVSNFHAEKSLFELPKVLMFNKS